MVGYGDNCQKSHEIYEEFEKPNLRPLPDKLFNLGGFNVIDVNSRKKVCRNYP